MTEAIATAKAAAGVQEGSAAGTGRAAGGQSQPQAEARPTSGGVSEASRPALQAGLATDGHEDGGRLDTRRPAPIPDGGSALRTGEPAGVSFSSAGAAAGGAARHQVRDGRRPALPEQLDPRRLDEWQPPGAGLGEAPPRWRLHWETGGLELPQPGRSPISLSSWGQAPGPAAPEYRQAPMTAPPAHAGLGMPLRQAANFLARRSEAGPLGRVGGAGFGEAVYLPRHVDAGAGEAFWWPGLDGRRPGDLCVRQQLPQHRSAFVAPGEEASECCSAGFCRARCGPCGFCRCDGFCRRAFAAVMASGFLWLQRSLSSPCTSVCVCVLGGGGGIGFICCPPSLVAVCWLLSVCRPSL
jgi:hypothetical protein